MSWDERLVVGARRGLPWWAAILVGFGLSVLGAVIDEKASGSLGFLFKACYFVGAVVAVAAVQRRALFGPMVQPPLVLAVTVPGVVLLTGGSGSSADTGTLNKLLSVASPLIDGFPTMAITTGVTLLFGFFRIYRERDPDAPVKLKGKKPAGEDADPAAARPRTRPAGSSRPGQTPLPADRRRSAPKERDVDAPPSRRPRPPADPGARSRRDPATPTTRGTRKPPPEGRRPRPPEADPRRRAEPRGDTPPPRRRPRTDEPPPAGRPRPPRREPPRRTRPWEDES